MTPPLTGSPSASLSSTIKKTPAYPTTASPTVLPLATGCASIKASVKPSSVTKALTLRSSQLKDEKTKIIEKLTKIDLNVFIIISGSFYSSSDSICSGNEEVSFQIPSYVDVFSNSTSPRSEFFAVPSSLFPRRFFSNDLIRLVFIIPV